MQPLIAALIGLALGTVAELLLDRAYRDEALGGRLYRCPACRRELRFVRYLPLVEFAGGLGRCEGCGARLPLRSLVLPIGGALLFGVSTLVFGELGAGLLGGFFGLVFLMLAVTDIERRLLPNRIVYPAVLLAIGVSWAWPDSSLLEVLGGGLVAIGVAAALLLGSLAFGAGAFGMGDVKMIVLIGFVVGLPSVVVAIFIGTVTAAVFSLFLLLTRQRTMRDYIPHGPFLAFGAVVALFWGMDIWDAYRG